MTEKAILGQALWEICGAQMLSSGSDEKGFWVEFNKSIDAELFSVIGERVSRLLKKEFRVVEMSLTSAKGLLRHHGQYAMAREIEGKGLFTMYQSDSYAAIAKEQSIGAILLTGWEGSVVIRGIAGESRGELKEKARRIRIGEKKDHRKRKELFDWIEERLVWFPEGVKRREEVKEILRGAYSELGMVEVIGDPLETIVGRVGRNVWGWGAGTWGRGIMEKSEGSFFYAKFESATDVHSYLQSLVKISKMLGLNAVCLLNGQEVDGLAAYKMGDVLELVAEDGYGELQRLSRINVGDGVLRGSLVESVEQVIALQIENE
jgi:hypothetical protein